MSENNENKLVPKLRFPEYTSDKWEIKSIDELCEILNNLRKPLTSNLREKGEYPYYGASGIIDFVKDFIFNERLLLVGEDGAKWGAYERTAFIAEGKYWVNNHAHVLKPTGVVDTLLENYLVKLDISPFITGAAPPKLTLGKLKSIPVPITNNPEEQQKIAACLSSLDEVIAGESQKLELLKERKKGLLQNLFPQDGETVPKLRFPEFKDNGEWELMQISNILNAESSNLALNKLELKQSGYAVYGADSIVGYIENFQHKEPYISIVKDGSGVGRLNLCDGETSTLGTLSSLKSKDEKKYKVVWAYYLLNTIDFSSYVKGSGIPHIYFSDYKSENIGVPKTEEQQKIASCLSSLDDLIAAQSQKIETLKLHKKGLLQGLFPPVKEVSNG